MSNAAFFLWSYIGVALRWRVHNRKKRWLHFCTVRLELHAFISLLNVQSQIRDWLICYFIHSDICDVFDLNINAIQPEEVRKWDCGRCRQAAERKRKRQKAWEREWEREGENRLLVGCDKLFLKPWRTRWAAVRKTRAVICRGSAALGPECSHKSQ